MLGVKSLGWVKVSPIHHPDPMTPVPITESSIEEMPTPQQWRTQMKSFKIFTTSIGDYGSVELITIPVDSVSF